MKRGISFVTIMLVAALSLFINQSNAQSKSGISISEARTAIAKSNSIYFKSFVNNDPSAFADRYAEDCIIMVPNAKALKGRKGALDFFNIAYNDLGLRNGKFITTDVYGPGNGYVVEEGLWQSFDKNNKLYDNGKFLVLWKKTNKGWKMFRDSFSSDNKAR
ncbi:DUF4440 domain-containing protein [Mucilaginibacter sp.]|jgi:ketosteroid isomerase-like protein|uniref:YybH family protein n=1 Tax=Mucilaginibacter sp. TaxID=1882438 RepID=UPI003564D422